MKLSLITYGLGNEIKPELIKPIKNSWVKPKGGLWASPINSAYGWKEWCEAEEFGNLSSSFSFEFEGNVLVIDSLHDMDKLPVCARLLRQVNTSVMPQRKGEYHGSI